jgi:S1/P1 Nuclease
MAWIRVCGRGDLVRSLWLAAFLTLLPAAPALPWGQEGHAIVAEIAQRRLSPQVNHKINALLGSELPALEAAQFSLASVASWADDYRADKHDETQRWHFVDIPYDRDFYDAAADCKLDPHYGDCIVNALARFRMTLADCTKPVAERAMALKFVVHFVGDIHQPLHDTTGINPDTAADDQGGNLIIVTFVDKDNKPQNTNLHHVWDTDLIMRKVYDWGEYVRLLETSWLPGKDVAALQAGDAVDWAQDAHKAAQIVAYNFRPDHVIDEEYYKDAIPIVDRQLALAGLRLARVLNEALQPTAQCP